MKQIMNFEDWYNILCEMSRTHGKSVADRSAWQECYDLGQSVEEAFFDEYPEKASPENIGQQIYLDESMELLKAGFDAKLKPIEGSAKIRQLVIMKKV